MSQGGCAISHFRRQRTGRTISPTDRSSRHGGRIIAVAVDTRCVPRHDPSSPGVVCHTRFEVPPRLHRPTLRLIHTSDVHISDDCNPARRLDGLRAVVEAALRRRADAVLIAGDLFDCARADASDVWAALDELARLSVPTLVTTGNHDALGPPSVYDRVSLLDAGEHLRFLGDPSGSHLVLDDLGLTVWARALVDHHPGHDPLQGYGAIGNGHWQVVLAHGHYTAMGERAERSSPIRAERIAQLGCDYLALGHWHRFLDVSSAGVPAFYPGSPSEPGGSYPSANLVTLDPEAGTSVERIPLFSDRNGGSYERDAQAHPHRAQPGDPGEKDLAR